MTQDKATIDSVSVMRATDFAKSYIQDATENALRCASDIEAKVRQSQGLCKFCFYFMFSRIGGAAMTERPCGICNKVVMYGSTATDKLCLACAKENCLCKQCGADSELRVRRVYGKKSN